MFRFAVNVSALLFGLCAAIVNASEVSNEELERWFNSDSLEPPRYQEVNEGQLTFLAKAPKANLHHHRNSITIKPQSLLDGWIQVQQCHSNLDQVPAAEVLFNKDTIRHITIVSYQHIDKAWVEGSTVQMQNIRANAVLCLQAESRALHANKDGSFSLRNGPFMRRFLDGYFPLQLSMELDYAGTGLTLASMSPSPQTGFRVTQANDHIHIEALFEGKLHTEFRFTRKPL